MKKVILGMVGLIAGAGVTFGALTDSVTVTATVTAGTPELRIAAATWNLGTFQPTVAAPRHVSDSALDVSSFPAASTWYIKAYTSHSATNTIGLQHATENTRMPLKFMVIGSDPSVTFDPNVAANWSGNDAVWAYVLDETSVSETTGDPVESKVSDSVTGSSDFSIWLAVDGANADSGAYSDTLTFELVIQ